MSSVATFLMRLVGVAPEQKEAEARFRRSLRQHEESEGALDSILGDLKRINRKAERNVELTKSVLTTRGQTDATPTGTD